MTVEDFDAAAVGLLPLVTWASSWVLLLTGRFLMLTFTFLFAVLIMESVNAEVVLLVIKAIIAIMRMPKYFIVIEFIV